MEVDAVRTCLCPLRLMCMCVCCMLALPAFSIRSFWLMEPPVYGPAGFGFSRQSNGAELTCTPSVLEVLEVDVSSQLARDEKKTTCSGLSSFISEATGRKKNKNKNKKRPPDRLLLD